MAFFVDTSAAVKLVVQEAESDALVGWIASDDRQLVASDLLRTELLRATRRHAPELIGRARRVIDAMSIMTFSTATFERAGLIDPVSVRSLDALHLAAALELGDELDGIVAYDDRLIDAARWLGITVVSPRA